MRNKRLLSLLAVPLLAACTNKGYVVEPVIGPDDDRRIEVPDLNEKDVWQNQDCFEVTYYSNTWSSHDRKLGIACLVEDESE